MVFVGRGSLREKLAIIGTGIAGMGTAHFLHKQFDIHYYEEAFVKKTLNFCKKFQEILFKNKYIYQRQNKLLSSKIGIMVD
jgi:hypothetical protein